MGVVASVLVVACGDDAVSPGDESTGTDEGTMSASGATMTSTGVPDPTTGDPTTDGPDPSDTTEADDSTTVADTRTDDSTTTDGSTTTSDDTTTSSDDTTTTSDDTTTSSDDTTTSSDDTTTSDDTTDDDTTTSPELCGNDLVDAGEDCDGFDLADETCSTLGNDGGTLACADDCTFDVSGCFVVESLQNDNGNCGFTQVGCSDDLGLSGNPQDLLECYVSTLEPPIEVLEVEYFLGTNVPLPDALDLVVHAWDGPGTAPGALLGSFALDPLIDIVAGGHTFALPVPPTAATPGFCVGLHGEDPFDGFRVEFTDIDGSGESWLTSPECGLEEATELSSVLTPGNFCIRPTIHGH